MNSTTDRRAFSRSENHDGQRAGQGPQILRLAVTFALTLDTVRLTNSPQLYFDVTAFRQPPRLYRLLLP